MNIWKVQQTLYKTLKDFLIIEKIPIEIYAMLPSKVTYPYLKVSSLKFRNSNNLVNEIQNFNIEINIISIKKSNEELFRITEAIYNGFADFLKNYRDKDNIFYMRHVNINEGLVSENIADSAIIATLMLNITIEFSTVA